jgi:hypothetical protein
MFLVLLRREKNARSTNVRHFCVFCSVLDKRIEIWDSRFSSLNLEVWEVYSRSRSTELKRRDDARAIDLFIVICDLNRFRFWEFFRRYRSDISKLSSIRFMSRVVSSCFRITSSRIYEWRAKSRLFVRWCFESIVKSWFSRLSKCAHNCNTNCFEHCLSFLNFWSTLSMRSFCDAICSWKTFLKSSQKKFSTRKSYFRFQTSKMSSVNYICAYWTRSMFMWYVTKRISKTWTHFLKKMSSSCWFFVW